ncbi:hypothetical protein [Sphingobium sp.]|uniref:hypothetical protein n=1 Tax=Sphingobium sp. TaxID=1912891 RepID=UPI000DB4F0F9|nr:hypothetical protein [Sphingobium sp.]PZU71069.1 MAG: hypothetical protein DI540_01040 [Sphingobium sp.]
MMHQAISASTSTAHVTMVPLKAAVNSMAGNTDFIMLNSNGIPLQEAMSVFSAGASRISWLDQQARKVRSLQHDWDGYGADPIDANVLEFVLGILRNALPRDSVPGNLVPGADGSVQAEWHLRNVSLGLLVEEDKTVSAWSYNPTMAVETEKFGMEAISYFMSLAKTALANV